MEAVEQPGMFSLRQVTGLRESASRETSIRLFDVSGMPQSDPTWPAIAGQIECGPARNPRECL